MVCNECVKKKCSHKVYQDKRSGRFKCPDHVRPKGSWSFMEIAIGNSPQSIHDLLQQHGLKLKER
jgi:hypothetical protein